MATKANAFVVVTLLLAYINLVEPLRCYECTASLGNNANCETLDYLQPRVCSQNSVCARYVLQKPNVEILFRRCAPENVCDLVNREFENNPSVTVKECNICSEDECNSSN
ncbi:hypothetical protein BDFB_004753 [Asbolus verrucosus]|uniref:Protein sleepless n=1 Tax=Asbolus verrucosus TaxID=1661398 RepID=A0A482V9V6_ASBVE|nr:hypothetical protein BDFB_004753 [Asbolus verrucosus]